LIKINTSTKKYFYIAKKPKGLNNIFVLNLHTGARMKKTKILVLFVIPILILGFAGLTGCIDEPVEDEETQLRMGFAFPTQIDPNQGTDFSSMVAHINLYDPLVFPSQEGVEPWIAEDWEKSNDGQTWTFEIREDVEFHSGRELTADDVMFSMKRYVMMGEGFGYLLADAVNLEESEVIDDYTVQFELDRDFGVFEYKLSRFYIFDSQEVEDNIVYDGDYQYGDYGDFGREYLTRNSAGSGPYQLTEIAVEDHVHMEKFEDYWGEMDDLAADEFRMLALADPDTERTMFADGDLEITSEWIPHTVKEDLVEEEDGQLGAYRQAGMTYITIHNRREPLDCVQVRKALAYAFDYETATEDILPASEPAEGIMPDILPGAISLDLPTYDLSQAEEELEKSEYYPEIVENPDEFEIDFNWNTAVPDTEHLALMLAGDAEEIGLNVNPVATSYGELVSMMADEESSPDITVMFNNAQYGDAAALIEARYHSRNARTTFQNEWLLDEEFDRKIDDAMNITDDEERFEVYAELQEELLDMMPSIFANDLASAHVYQPYVEWPHMEEDPIPDVQYYIDARRIRVTPPEDR